MNKPRPIHTLMSQFPIVDGHLQLAGRAVSEIVANHGETPVYLYDRTVMNAQVANCRTHLPDAIELHYAMKANPMPAVVAHMVQQVDGVDVASAKELVTAMAAGANPQTVSFAGPGKRDSELQAAIEAGICINAESPNEIERLAKIGEQLGKTPRVAVRVNPDFELKTSGMKMSGGPKQFGIDAEQVPDVLKRIGELPLQFEGFHIFSGSQNLRPEALIEAHAKTFELAERLAADAPVAPHTVNIGGGFGIPYFPGEDWLDLAPIGEHLATLLENRSDRLAKTTFVIELGRYFVGPAGLYVSRVIDKKISRGETFLVVDGGLHHHLAASGNFGQVIRKNYPLAVIDRMDSDIKETVNVVGPLCTPLDLLGNRMQLPKAEIGDLIAVYQSGAYGFTASPRDFLSHPSLEEVLI